MARAVAVAKEKSATVEDSGSWNYDQCFLPSTLGRPDLFSRVSEAVGSRIGGYPISTKWWKGYLLNASEGVTSRRTAFVQAMAEELKEFGAHVYYQVD